MGDTSSIRIVNSKSDGAVLIVTLGTNYGFSGNLVPVGP